MVKNPPTSAGDARDMGSISGSGEEPWSRKWQPALVLLPGKFHGQRSLQATVQGAAESCTCLGD